MVRCVVLAVLSSLTIAAAAGAAPAVVDLRVEGSATTPFEARIETDVKRVVQDGESRQCDGTNADANPSPGPTMIGGLDDAAALGDFTWQGTWFDSLEDFFIDRIGPDENSGTANWGLVLNWEQTERGGCQTQVGPGDEILFAYDIFTKLHLLKLIAPRFAQVGEAFQVKVVDGETKEPIAGAAIEGVATGADGLATLTYDSAGLRTPKATRVDSVRSNAAAICVYEPGTEPCAPPEEPDHPSTPDPPPAEDTGPLEREPPLTRITHPRSGVRYRRGPLVIRGRVRELGSGIDRAELAIRRRRDGHCSSWFHQAGRFARRGCGRTQWFRVADTPRWSYRLPRRLGPGRYAVVGRSIDKAGNVGQAHRVRFTVRRRASG